MTFRGHSILCFDDFSGNKHERLILCTTSPPRLSFRMKAKRQHLLSQKQKKCVADLKRVRAALGRAIMQDVRSRVVYSRAAFDEDHKKHDAAEKLMKV
jgi:hypothetical protein